MRAEFTQSNEEYGQGKQKDINGMETQVKS
jgi:hypothetical protein